MLKMRKSGDLLKRALLPPDPELGLEVILVRRKTAAAVFGYDCRSFFILQDAFSIVQLGLGYSVSPFQNTRADGSEEK